MWLPVSGKKTTARQNVPRRRRSPLSTFIAGAVFLTLLLGAFLYSGLSTSSGGTAPALGRLAAERPTGLAASPALLQGQSFSSVQSRLPKIRSTPAVRATYPEANFLTAVLCKADGNRPSTICSGTTIKKIERNVQ